MNRRYNPDFFQLWDWAKEIEAKKQMGLRPKDQLEIDAEEEALLEASGFYSDTNYQDAILNYQARVNATQID